MDMSTELLEREEIPAVFPYRGMLEMLSAPFKKLLLLNRAQELRDRLIYEGLRGFEPDRILEALDVGYEVSEEDLAHIPKNGKLVVVANHPFGMVEGVVLASILRGVRPDAKIMGNHMLRLVCPRECEEGFIFVDNFGRRESTKNNIAPLRESMKWLGGGGALGIFPSGTVSHFQFDKRRVADPPWSDTVARIVRKTGSPVVPVYFEGKNSALFHALGMIHPRLRTLMLLRETFNKTGTKLRVRIGRPLSSGKIAKIDGDDALTRYMRVRTHMLERRPERIVRTAGRLMDISPGPSPESLAAEVNGLPAGHVLVENGSYAVFSAEAARIPLLLREIGRLREITFRGTGEGTGKSVDIDRFDQYYTHLILWNKEKREVVGGYRVGRTDAIVARHGIGGLYTHTLFSYGRVFLDRIGPALELGRSFIRSEYQRDYQPLLMLWKGIGRMVAAQPRHRTLFGPVSISGDYSEISRQLIVAFSQLKKGHEELAPLVRGRRPADRFRPRDVIEEACSCLDDFQDLSDVISEIEKDGKGVPVLLRHYVKLGGRLVGFHVDRKFNNALDGLIIVDLLETDRRALDRYMGPAGASAFLDYHGDRDLDCCA